MLTYLAKRKHDSNGNNNIQINSRLNADFGKNTCFQCLSHYIALTTALLTYVTKRKHYSDGNNNIQINSRINAEFKLPCRSSFDPHTTLH